MMNAEEDFGIEDDIECVETLLSETKIVTDIHGVDDTKNSDLNENLVTGEEDQVIDLNNGSDISFLGEKINSGSANTQTSNFDIKLSTDFQENQVNKLEDKKDSYIIDENTQTAFCNKVSNIGDEHHTDLQETQVIDLRKDSNFADKKVIHDYAVDNVGLSKLHDIPVTDSTERQVINLEDNTDKCSIDQKALSNIIATQESTAVENEISDSHSFWEEDSHSIFSMQDTHLDSLAITGSDDTSGQNSKSSNYEEVIKTDDATHLAEESVKEMSSLSGTAVTEDASDSPSTQTAPKLASGLFTNDKSADLFSMPAKTVVSDSPFSSVPTTISSLFAGAGDSDDFLKPPSAPLHSPPLSAHPTECHREITGMPSNLQAPKETHNKYGNNYVNGAVDSALHSTPSKPQYFTPNLDTGLQQNLPGSTTLVSSSTKPAVSPYESPLRREELTNPNKELNMSTNFVNYSNYSNSSNYVTHPNTNQQLNHSNNNAVYSNLNGSPSADQHANHYKYGANEAKASYQTATTSPYPPYAAGPANGMKKDVADASKPALFIPSMYSSSTSNNTQAFFVPEKVDDKPVQPMNYIPSPPGMANNLPPYPGSNVSLPPHPSNVDSKRNNVEMTQISLEAENQRQRGILEWIRNAVMKDWSTGAHNFKKHIKNATDSVLTTLDPGMKEYLKPGLNIGVASQRLSMLVGLKDGFSKSTVSVPNIQEQILTIPNTPLLPLGFERALKFSTTTLDYLAAAHFDFSSQYVLVSSQAFLTELVAGRWSVMYCVGLKDPYQHILLHTFSQPIPIPNECLTMISSRMAYDNGGECSGYNVTIDEAVRQFIHGKADSDWCLALTGIPEYQIISSAAQCLSVDYQRHLTAINKERQQATPNYNQPPVYPPENNHAFGQQYKNDKNYSTGNNYDAQSNHRATKEPQGKNYYSLPMDAFG